ncbi:MAG: hypothetical protein U0R26_08665 [Solirubrobacterales bacterium]
MGVSLLKEVPQPAPSPERQPAADVYLTDETRLFRCLPGSGGGTVLLEDCLTLENFHFYFEELAKNMRLVRPAGSCGPGAGERS